MKKSLLIASFALVLAGLVSCGTTTTSSSAAAGGAEIALVTDVGNIDDHSFNEACWKGCQAYSTTSGVSTKYYRPTEDSTTARVSMIDTAVANGAKVVVMPGFLFNSSIKIVQDKYPAVRFLGVDCDPSDADNNYAAYDFKTNVTSIKYNENEAGFFAGYAIVKEGYTNLGFCGGIAVPAVVNYGQGYLWGADYAAKEMNLADKAIKCNYWYAGTFAPSADIVTKMAGWYEGGTKVTFSCGGGIYASVDKAALDTNTSNGNENCQVIGVDVDQSSLSPRIITSSMKNLQKTVTVYLDALYKNNMTWGTIQGQATAGKSIYKGVTDDAVGLPTDAYSYLDTNGATVNVDPWRFKTFTKAEYQAIYAKVKDGTIKVPHTDTGKDIFPVTKVDTTYVE